MKKSLKIFAVLSLFAMSLTGCNLLPDMGPKDNNNQGQTQEMSDFEKQTREIYNLYVANGGTLTYEEWLQTIKGEKGDKGDKGDKGEQGNPGQQGQPGQNGQDGKDGADGKDGKDGADGENGLTPYIGENGNWWIGDIDTGVSTRGEKGDTGTSITSTVINSEGELVISFSDGTQVNVGKLTFTEHVHEYTSEVVNPTCTTDGYVTFTCKTCGHIETVINKATGHIYESWREVVSPTCDSEGLKMRSCMLCGHREEQTIEKHDHQISTQYIHNAATHWHYCELCGVVLEEHNHTYVDGTCSACGFVQRDETLGNGLIYTLNEDGNSYSVADYGSCTETDIVIPDMYNGKPVIRIEQDAFASSSITSVIMSNNITSIGANAFKNCRSLTNIVLSNNIKRIEDATFQSCAKLQSIIIPEGVEYVGTRAFNSCDSITSIVFPNTVTYIGHSAMYNCNKLTKVVLSSSLSYIDGYAFANNYSLKEVIIPEGVKSIGYNAFCGSSIESIYIPSTIENIESNVFTGCTYLATATFADPDNWSIGDWNNGFTSIPKEILQDETVAARKLVNSELGWKHTVPVTPNPSNLEGEGVVFDHNFGGWSDKTKWYDLGVISGDFTAVLEFNMQACQGTNAESQASDCCWRTILPVLYKNGWSESDKNDYVFRMDWFGWEDGDFVVEANNGVMPDGFDWEKCYEAFSNMDIKLTITKDGANVTLDWIWTCLATEGYYAGKTFEYHQSVTLEDSSSVGIALSGEYVVATIYKAEVTNN